MSKSVIIVAVLAAVISLSCEGPMGPPGPGLGSLSDPSIMPNVIYTYPPQNSVGPFPELYLYYCYRWEGCYDYSQFQVRFNKFMDVSSVRRSVRLSSPIGDIRADTNFITSVGGDVFILSPVDSNGNRYNLRFRVGTVYSIGVDSTARDINGNLLIPPYTATFVPEPYFRVKEFSPKNGSTEVSVSSNINISFNSKVDTAILSHLEIQPAIRGNWWIGYDSTYVYFNYLEPLMPATRYTVTLDGSAEDLEGNRVEAPFVSQFTTIGFRVSWTSPVDGSGNVSLSSRINAWFTLPLDTATIKNAFHLTPTTAGDFYSMYYGTWGIEFAPRNGLLSATVYTVRIDTTLRSLVGTNLSAPVEYTFTTAPFAVVSTNPVDGQIGWPRNNYIYIRTNAPLDPVTITGSIQITPPASLSYSYCDGCSEFQFYPTGGLNAMTEYTVTVRTSLKTKRGEPLPAPYGFSFTTGPD